MADLIRRLHATSIDGRAQNPRYAQNQLKRLFDALVKEKSLIQTALRRDTSYLPAEVEAEYYLTLANIREQYSSISVLKALDEEYSIANNKDNPLRRSPVGCVYVVPASHTPLYATITPLCAAVASGNCVALELKQTLSELNALLRHLLTAALDTGTFVVVEQKPDKDDLPSSFVTVQDSYNNSDFNPTLKRITCPSSARVVAVVDRSADIQNAAHEIVRSRFSFKGRSPYAPDLVLVNEFALKDFCIAAVQKATTYFSEQVGETMNGSVHKAPRRDDDGNELQKALAEDGIETLVSASRGSVILVKNRTSPLLHRKLTHPTLLIHVVSSLDDAIDTASSSASSSSLLATYLFADTPSAKYLSQFIPASLSCTNAIPPSLLLGPAYPLGFTPSISPAHRFTQDMFTRPTPEFITPDPLSRSISQVLYGQGRGREKLCEETLPPTNQPEGKGIGFFEQGLLTGAGILVTGIVGTVALAGVYAVPAVVKRLR